MFSRLFLSVAFIAGTTIAQPVLTAVDLDGDGLIDTIKNSSYSGKTGVEQHISVQNGKNGITYNTVKIASAECFFSLIPLNNPCPGDSFYSQFLKVVEDSICKGFSFEKQPDNSLLWLLDYYDSPSVVDTFCYQDRWGGIPASFNSYFTIISRNQYPHILQNCPKQLTHTIMNDSITDSLFTNADQYYVLYFMHNHGFSQTELIRPVPTCGKPDIAVYKTKHAVLIKKDGLFNWIFIADNVGRLRQPTVGDITLKNNIATIELKTVYEKRVIINNITNRAFFIRETIKQ